VINPRSLVLCSSLDIPRSVWSPYRNFARDEDIKHLSKQAEKVEIDLWLHEAEFAQDSSMDEETMKK
jgi:hypothetical protein